MSCFRLLVGLCNDIVVMIKKKFRANVVIGERFIGISGIPYVCQNVKGGWVSGN